MPEGNSRPFDSYAPLADHALHARLAHWNRRRLAMQVPSLDWRDTLHADHDMAFVEREFAEALRAQIAPRAAAAPREPNAFVGWFEALKHDGPGQGDPLFPWLEAHATYEQMRWFVEQEVAGEAGFDDLVALSQIKAPPVAKLELARNYWDEMGRGNQKGMHGPMLEKLVRALNVKPEIETTLAPSLALGNTMVALGMTREYAYHIIGALGVIELTAPGRALHVAAGLKRLGLPVRDRHYFELHAVLDVKHSEAWNREVLFTLVDERPDCARYIAEGALMRLACGEACFEAYKAHLWDGKSAPL